MVEIDRVEIDRVEISTIKTTKLNSSLYCPRMLFKNLLPKALIALTFSLSAHAQQMPAEIEYYVDDNVTNQIPYFDNRFRIDEQLDEVTLLFYHRSGAQPIILVRPDGSKLNINNYPEDKVQWFDDSTFDMVKIKSPMIGPWQVIGEVQPNSKIMVVSEIRLEVTPLPEIILQGETLKMSGRLFNGEMAIDNPSFKNVLTLDVDFFSTNNSAYDNFGAEPVKLASFRDDGRDLDEHASDSLFTGEFELDFAPGEWEPIYIVRMPMATRELRQKPIVVQKNPISIAVATTEDENGAHIATFTIDDSFVKADSILIQGKITFPDRQVEPFTVTQEQGLKRTYKIAFTEPGVHRIKIGVFGDTINGREFRAILPEFTFNVERSEGTAISKLNGDNNLTAEQKKARSIANAAEEAEKLAQALAKSKAAQEAKIADKQQETLWYIVGGNTLVIVIAALMFIFIRRKK
ncbi:TIGR03503 family protein [Cognaticolwellia beringensis]|uniref:TIGR03503 family protein n=1 Tax=Cognaticolwellia beringensis TaxID=1967665 RepID=A0A222GD63_9GAMM|nr:TIGR03503 family protein [Cognaticolwellia beringensis]ASP49790.1 TIGR03503 family protein [Cognaticolwellia beringensis]